MSETKTVETVADLSGTFVTFEEGSYGGTADVRMIPLYLRDVSQFEGYRDDARHVIRVLIDGGNKEDLRRINQTQLNAMGINNFLAAMASELLDHKYHLNLPPKTSVDCRYCGTEITDPDSNAFHREDCGSCGEED